MNLSPWMKRVLGLGAGILLSFFPFLSPSPLRADIREIPGIEACEVLLGAMAEAFNAKHPGHRVMVPPSIGSSGGARLVGTDQAVLARVAQPLKDHEKAYGLRYLVFGRDMVIFAGGARVTPKNLTESQLIDIYSGKIMAGVRRCPRPHPLAPAGTRRFQPADHPETSASLPGDYLPRGRQDGPY